MSFSGVPKNNLQKPIYLIKAVLRKPGKAAFEEMYLRSEKVVEGAAIVEVSGWKLENNDMLSSFKDPNVSLKVDENWREVNIKLPWDKVLWIQNITYKKGE